MVVVLEDLHWAAPTTLAVAEYLGDKLSKTGSAAAQDRHRMPRCRQSTGFTPTVRTSMRAGAADVARRKIAAMSATTSSGAATPKARARPTIPISHQELRAHVHCVARRHPICLMTAQRVSTRQHPRVLQRNADVLPPDVASVEPLHSSQRSVILDCSGGVRPYITLRHETLAYLTLPIRQYGRLAQL
jgi:hypothetical protein